VGSILTATPNSWTGLPTPAYQPTGANAGRTFNGYNVMSIQNALTVAGIPTSIDGIYGPQTTANVRTFQSRFALTVDGIVGPQTWGRMSSQAAAASTFSYAWFRCAAAVTSPVSSVPTGCASIGGASSTTYTTTAVDASRFVTVAITATNRSGALTIWAPATTAVGP